MDRRLVRAARPGRFALALAVALGMAGGVATIMQWSAFARLVAGAFLDRQGLVELWPTFLLFLAAVALRAMLSWGREVAAQRGATRITAALRVALYGHLTRLGPVRLREERAGGLIAAATGGIERLDPYFARFLPQVVLSQIVPLLIAVAIVPRDWMSAVLLLSTAPVLPILMILVGSYSEERINAQWTALTRLKGAFLDAIQGLTTIRTLGIGAAGRERVARQSEVFRVRTIRALRYAFLSSFVLEFITSVAIALVAVTLGVRLISNGMAFEPAFLVLLLAPEFYRPLRDLGTHHHAGMEGKAAAEQIFAILDQPVPAQPAICPATLSPTVAPALTISDLRYRYRGAGQLALAGVDLTISPGERVAIVGASGAGKSTLVNLLLGFLTPDSGTIAADGRSIAELAEEVWRAQIAYVPQRPHLFAGSVLDNLRLARPNAPLAAVRQAAELAGAAAFIAALPLGYDTLLGEHGVRLSKGQAQRIAIARAFLKDAPILILDEPTAHLDPESESAVRVALEHLAVGRTVLLIAHRLATVGAADRIVVLAGGRVVEDGTHADLVALGGHYARLAGAAPSSLLPATPAAATPREVSLV
ncbi:MAG TPA: thiol reductant ABC exporter subunit CydD [Thermomicrobiales bacterium]|jgi:ATP-binding cassette subfamily C protein CydD